MPDDDAGAPVVVSGVVWLCYHQLAVVDGGESLPGVEARSTNALVDVYEDAAVIATGIHTGVVNVTTEARLTPPPSVELHAWDEVVEVSVEMTGGDARLVVLMAAVPDSYGRLTLAGPGTYRLRAHARGRDTAIDGTADVPFEDYLLVLWPAPPAPQVIHKETDRYGAGWHAYDATAAPVPPPAREVWDRSGHRPPEKPQRA